MNLPATGTTSMHNRRQDIPLLMMFLIYFRKLQLPNKGSSRRGLFKGSHLFLNATTTENHRQLNVILRRQLLRQRYLHPTEVAGLSSPSPYRRSTRTNKGTFPKTRFMDEVYLNSLGLLCQSWCPSSTARLFSRAAHMP
jgi:hypothetical protein